MREIFGPVVRHLWAWHKWTGGMLIGVKVMLFVTGEWQLGLGLLLWMTGWVFTDVNGHAVAHHADEWTASPWVRWMGHGLCSLSFIPAVVLRYI